MMRRQLGSGESRLETVTGYILISGVMASLILEIIGIVLLYRAYGHLGISQDVSFFIQGHDFFSFIYQQLTQKHTGGMPILLLAAGIIVLVLTPYVRVIASVIYFGWERNFKYLLITLFVLVVVTLSLTLH